MEVDSAVAVDVAAYFTDPDGDTLTYAAVSSSEANATVTVAGSAVTVTGVAAGSAMVTVTARDPDGLAAQQTFAVMVPNRAPLAVGTIDSLDVFVDSVALVDVAGYFTDPDGDELGFQAVSPDTTLVAVVVSGSVVTATGVGVGSANVTVTAQDTAGLSAEQNFVVTVPNRAPLAVGTIAEQVVEVDSVTVVDVAEYFTDPDRQELAYSVAVSDTTRVTVTVSASEVAVAGVAKGNATLTVTATDPGGLTAEQGFVVTVPNRPPRTVEVIADRDVYVFDTIEIRAAVHFSDPDGDSLAYAATSSDTILAAVSVSDGVVRVTGVAVGSVTVTVTATDPEGLAAQQDFAVTMPNRAPEAVGTVVGHDVYVGDSVTVDVAANFVEPDGQPLQYAVAASSAVTVAVGASGSVVTIRGAAVGSAAVTVTAHDPGGLWAEQQFSVTVPNRAPETVGVIADRELEVDSVLEVEFAAHFTEPDGEPLEYSAASSDTARVMVAIADGAVTLRGVRAGQATVTVMATDPGGLTAGLSFGVRVANRPPVAVGAIPDRVVRAGNREAVDVGDHFEDPDGDVLAYFAASSDTTRLRASTLGRVVTLRGVAGGRSTVTVTARDPEGLTARQTFVVTVPNQGPRTVGTIASQSVAPGGSFSLDVSPYFTDPDGDDLTYAATSSNRARARVGASGSTVTVRGVSAGVATITVRAGDPEGLVASQSFEVTVVRPNRAPRPTATIPDQSLATGRQLSVDLGSYFTDPDGDQLDFSATSSTSTIASVAVSSDSATVTGHAEGTVTITVTATDPGGLTANQSFDVRVEDSPNRAPVVIGRISDLNALVGERYLAPLALVFEDPDGDPLTYSTTSSNTSVADPEIVEDTIFVSAVGVGTATVSVTASDPEGLTATESFRVDVVPGGGFDMWLAYTDAVTEAQLARFRLARNAWEAVLARTELPDYQVPDPARCLNLTASVDVPVDDHLVLVHVRAIDGSGGTVAHARYCHTRSSDGSPVVSAVIFDEADIDHLMSRNMLGTVAFHEFAHGLGFLSLYWDDHGLLDTGSDPHFKGAQAINAFNAAGGGTYPDAKVPISPGDYSHWREDVFGREGMTPVLTFGAANPFSAITLQAMADVGYIVDVSLADDYQLPNTVPPDIAARETGEAFDLSNDVVQGPVVVLDRQGGVVRVIPGPPGSPEPFFDHHEVVRIERGGGNGAREGGLTLVPPERESIWRLVQPSPSRRPR